MFALGVLHVIVSAATVVPGYLSIDEAIYHMMMKNFAADGGLEIWTGYQEYPSAELAHDFLRVHFGRPVSQYPYLYPVVALPFYLAAGFQGLFVLNAVAFMVVTLLCFGIAQKLFRDKELALNSCFIFVAATFAWEYSQAAWPHMTSLLFIIAAFFFAVCSYMGASHRERYGYALLAGLLGGFAPGIRLDAFLVVPCMVLPFLFVRPWRPLEGFLVCLAAIPGLGVLTATNFIKFGVLNPFSYGTSLAGHTLSVPYALVALAAAVLLLIWILSRTAVAPLSARYKYHLLAAAAAVAILAVLLPQTRAFILRTAEGWYMMLVDLRILDMSVGERAMGRSLGGGIVYLDALKKSLLQSLPYLVVLVCPLLAILRRKDAAPLGILFLMPLTVTAFFAFIRDHGGLCLNLRFFLSALPFTSILTAYAMRDFKRRWGISFRWWTWAWLITATAGLYFLLSHELGGTAQELEFLLLVIPLMMAGFLLASLAAGEVLKAEGVRSVRITAYALFVASLTWAGSVAFSYDYPRHAAQRATNYLIGGQALRLIPEDSLFFTAPYIDPFMRLTEKNKVRVALPGLDQFKDLPEVTAFYLKAGKRVFAVFPLGYWKELQAGPLASYRVIPVLEFPGSMMGEITPLPEGGLKPES